ncbi:MAG TPA: acyl-CoA dehydrogenase family protein [Candidatus Binatia bacterium]|nr:acyl-CoA dehydrogenase family protein [Candidatus Binatia bacterium]
MTSSSHLDWPFLEPHHKALATDLDRWASRMLSGAQHDHSVRAVDDACRKLVRQLGEGGWLKYAIGGVAYGASADTIDTRAVCLIRETLARYSGLADFAFAMQGLGSGAISIFGSNEQKQRYLPRVAQGTAIAAFAISEPDAGSDVAALQCAARIDGDSYLINGEKTWISNGGIADFYLVFARTGEAAGAKGISAFLVDANAPGLEIAERIEVMAPHPLARLAFKNCRIPATQRLGGPSQGFKIAMSTLDIFRSSVAAAALGFARCALHEALSRSTSRKMFGQALADFQLTQAKLAKMATDIDAAALLTYRAARLKDMGRQVTVEAAMAKMTATEIAQQAIDSAVQIFGALGVVSGQAVERLYREIRPLRIYEGATEVQQLIIARGVMKAHQERGPERG